MHYLLAFFFPVFITLIATPIGISRCERWGLLDHPDARKNHRKPTPLAGGLVIFPLTVAGLLVGFWGDSRLYYLIPAITLIFCFGIWDDLKTIHYSIKFLVQTAAAALVILSGLQVDLNGLGFLHHAPKETVWLISIVITLLWIVGLTNAVNLIDGLDGLASGLVFIALVGVVSVGLNSGVNGETSFALIIAGGVLGFLRYNLLPARTFLGDSGSLLLGFNVAFISIIHSAKSATFLTLAVPILFIAIPMVDTVWVFTRRSLNGTNPFKPDRGHLHHRLLELNFTPRQTLGYFYIFSVLLGSAGLLMANEKRPFYLSLAAVFIALMLVIVKMLQVFNFHSFIYRLNLKIWAFGQLARGYDFDQPFGLGAVGVILILLPINISLALLSPAGGGEIFIACSVLVALLGIFDILGTRKNGNGQKDTFVSISLFFLFFLIQLELLYLWHPHALFQGNIVPYISGLIILAAVVVSVFSRSFLVFIDEPLEIIILYTGFTLCVAIKYAIGVSNFLPFILVPVNSMSLLLIVKAVLKRSQIRETADAPSSVRSALWKYIFAKSSW